MTCEYSKRKALNFTKNKKIILAHVLSNGHFSPPLLEIESLLKIFEYLFVSFTVCSNWYASLEKDPGAERLKTGTLQRVRRHE